MEILDKNLSINSDIRDLYNSLKSSLYSEEITKDNMFTLKIDNIYIHSKYSPIKEAERLVDLLLNEDDVPDVIILFGNGLGYTSRIIFERLIEKSKSTIKPNIIYIEKDEKLFLKSLELFDISNLLSSKNVKFFINSSKETIGSFLQSIPTKSVKYIYQRSSYALNEEYFKTLQNYLSYVLDRKDMNSNTLKKFQTLWTKNIIENIPYYTKSKPVSSLKNLGKGSVGFLVAGGPTLSKSIEVIKEYKDRAIVIAVETAYKYLKKNGITPDIIATIDPQYWNYKYLENEKITDSLIVCDSSVYSKIFRVAPISNYFIPDSVFLVSTYFDVLKKRGTILAGGSVATTAFDALRILGVDEIYLFGLDLSFPNRETHFRGAYFETRFLTEATYFKTANNLQANYLLSIGLSKTLSTNKGTVDSDQRMFLFKKWFDREIPLSEQRVNLPNLGGVMLDGANLIELDSIDITADKSRFTEIKKIILNNNSNIDPAIIQTKIDLFLKESKKIKTITNKIVSLIPSSGKIQRDSVKQIEREERALTESVQTKEILNILSSGVQDAIIEISENYSYSENEEESLWQKTKNLYQSINNIVDFYIRYLEKIAI